MNAILLLLLLAGAPELPAELEVLVGAQQLLDVPKLARVEVGNREVAGAQKAGKAQLLLYGSRPGETTLRIWTKGRTDFTEIKLHVTQLRPRPGMVAQPVTGEPLTLERGEERLLLFPGLTHARVSDARVLDVGWAPKNQLLIRGGRNVGDAKLSVEGENSHEITVHVVN